MTYMLYTYLIISQRFKKKQIFLWCQDPFKTTTPILLFMHDSLLSIYKEKYLSMNFPYVFNSK